MARRTLTYDLIKSEITEAGWPYEITTNRQLKVTVPAQRPEAGRTLTLSPQSNQPTTYQNFYTRLNRHGFQDDLRAARERAAQERREKIEADRLAAAQKIAQLQQAADGRAAATLDADRRERALHVFQVTGWDGTAFKVGSLPKPETVVEKDGTEWTDYPTITQLITPDVAAAWIANPVCNPRPEKERTRKTVTAAIRAGKWDTNHQGFAVCAEHGGLLDGMNRSRVIHRLGASVRVKVTYGMPHNSFVNMDQGSNRSISDMGANSGELPATLTNTERRIVMTVAKILHHADAPEPVSWSRWDASSPDPALVLDSLARLQRDDPGLIVDAATTARLNAEQSKGVPAGLALAWFVIHRAWPETPYAADFFARLADNDGVPSRSAVGRLREHFYDSTTTPAKRKLRTATDHAAKTVKAYNRYVVGALLGEPWTEAPSVRFMTTEDFPVPHNAATAERAAMAATDPNKR